jgi:hypothetical protein
MGMIEARQSRPPVAAPTPANTEIGTEAGDAELRRRSVGL